MNNITSYYGLKHKQANYNFIDVKLDDDNLLFIDPRLIEFSVEKSLKPVAKTLKTFISKITKAAITNNRNDIKELTKGLSEPKETRLGFAYGNSVGNSMGKKLIAKFIMAIQNNAAIKSGKINHWGDLELILDKISCDRVSDMTTKIIKEYLIEFTISECKKHKIPTKLVLQTDILNPKTFKWEDKMVYLPVENIDGFEKPIIFVPKSIVRRHQDANSNLSYFYRYAIDKYVMNDTGAVYGIPRNGKNNTLLKKDIKNKYPQQKSNFLGWIAKYKNLLIDYKSFFIKEKLNSLTDAKIESVIYFDRLTKAA